jgi:peptidoglycan/LPS O-acetylase OafA/YrhL
VFFTLSGYLITDILVGQWAARGRIRLADFWRRRARRLLPALFVMLAVVTLWVTAFARTFLPGFRGNVIASLLYVSNWWYVGQHSSYYARFGRRRRLTTCGRSRWRNSSTWCGRGSCCCSRGSRRGGT